MNEIATSHASETGPISREAPIFSRFVDDEIYIPLLVEFADDLPGHVSELGHVIARRSHVDISRLSHRLKGAAATYGYPDLSVLVGEAEQLANEPPGVASDLRLDQLATEMALVCERICRGTKLRSATTPL